LEATMVETVNSDNLKGLCHSAANDQGYLISQMSQPELVSLLDNTIYSWNHREIRPSHILYIIEHVNQRLGTLDKAYLNAEPVSVCYFSALQTVGALLVQTYLETKGFKTELHGITANTDLELLINKWNCKKPDSIVFSFSAFQFIYSIQSYSDELLKITDDIFAGGVVFNLDESLKDLLPRFVFPADLTDLAKLIDGRYLCKSKKSE
jgi:hypothetical protein